MVIYLLLLGLSLLVFSLVMWRCKLKETMPVRRSIRRLFYSLWIIEMGILFWLVPPASLVSYGYNMLGLHPYLWVTILLFSAGVVIDVLVISAPNVKSLAMGTAKMDLDDATESVETNLNLYQDLASKVYAFSAVIEDMRSQPLSLPRTQSYDLLSEFKGVIKEYLSRQANKKQGIDILEVKDAILLYKMSPHEVTSLNYNIEQDSLTELKHRANEYIVLMPYRCYSVANHLLLISIKSENAIIKEEVLLVRSILANVEDRLVDFYTLENH